MTACMAAHLRNDSQQAKASVTSNNALIIKHKNRSNKTNLQCPLFHKRAGSLKAYNTCWENNIFPQQHLKKTGVPILAATELRPAFHGGSSFCCPCSKPYLKKTLFIKNWTFKMKKHKSGYRINFSYGPILTSISLWQEQLEKIFKLHSEKIAEK